MTSIEKLILVLSYYRDAEIQGARLLFKLMSRLRDGDVQAKLTVHVADEMRHAALWTKRITDLDRVPVKIDDGYQRRLGQALGLRTTLLELLALTIVAEERAHRRYRAHAARPDVDPKTLEILTEVSRDEQWHLGWIEQYMVQLAGGDESIVRETLARIAAIEQRVSEDLESKERELFGFSFSDPLAACAPSDAGVPRAERAGVI